MNENFSDVLNKFSDILKEKNIDLNKILNNASSEDTCSSSSNDTNTILQSNNDFQLDMESIIKIKDLLFKLNKNQNCSRNQLLRALKPYLDETKKEKLEQYIKIASIIDLFDELEIENTFLSSNKNGYDFILIITLLLLII